ncbi:uncharacterized protein BO80DRAFT_442820 [Aspergillus ibericus CBS 121593]|uniref:Uncharacterized protein n=1 Tax=Aspergillus ibericus CBS 121593 TaxID=1448316 RepID=A0A395H7J9_9EURO|nr:hypothetical protein BO80DRAFT_442820 [Aspergillus ibericus CBS 121593]RAL03135.1 hypothetical protein BO80DRAFT_442820 [Aspergillus ibericus CBS 121593]
MPRTISLSIFDNGAKPAHWAIFIPTGDQGLRGKIIHRNYDFLSETRIYHILPLAQVSEQYVRDTVGNGRESIDTIARDRMESVAVVVPAPGRSLNPFDPTALNCQSWIFHYVQRLSVEGLVSSDASLVLQSAPRVLRK